MTFLPKNILYFLVVLKLYMTTHKLLKRMSGCGFLVCLFLDLICNASEFFFFVMVSAKDRVDFSQ